MLLRFLKPHCFTVAGYCKWIEFLYFWIPNSFCSTYRCFSLQLNAMFCWHFAANVKVISQQAWDIMHLWSMLLSSCFCFSVLKILQLFEALETLMIRRMCADHFSDDSQQVCPWLLQDLPCTLAYNCTFGWTTQRVTPLRSVLCSPVTTIKCWKLTFLQTTDTITLLCVLHSILKFLPSMSNGIHLF